MARYIIGDVQGCFASLQGLIERLNPDLERDELWLAGDLVNRGPSSLETLRWAVAHDVPCVLGNHDLYLLALAAGVAKPKKHTLQPLLDAPDSEALLQWLRQRPLLLSRDSVAMVHAGFHPEWTFDDALLWSDRAETELRGPDYAQFLQALFSGSSDPTCAALNCLTRIRMCRANGEPEYGYSGPPERAPEGLSPWYSMSRALAAERTVYFGHWAALGHRAIPGAISLDGGCVWGNQLIAVRTNDGQMTSVECVDGDRYSSPN